MGKSRTVRFFYDDDVLVIEEREAILRSGYRRREWVTERVSLTPKEQQQLVDKIDSARLKGILRSDGRT